MRVVITAGRSRTSIVRPGSSRVVELTPRIQMLVDKGFLVIVRRLTESPQTPEDRPYEAEAPPGWEHVGGGWYAHPEHERRYRASALEALEEE